MSVDTAEDAVASDHPSLHSVWNQLQVVAVILVRDDPVTLPAVRAALTAQTRSPDEIVIVDLTEDDPVTDASEGAEPRDIADAVPTRTVRLPRRTSVADAVAAALGDPRPPGQVAEGSGQGDVRGSWIWLLTNDSAPEPAALRRLLSAVETSPSVVVAGCKQVEWRDRERLRDVGLGLSWLGAVVTGLDRGELDQGQQDARSDVLAVSLPGMLVRRDVWRALGGPDPELRSARAEIDLCRRARLRGHRVVVVPGAVMVSAATADVRDERHDALLLRLAWTPVLLLPLAVLWSVLAGAGRALSWLILKQPGRSLVELAVLVEVLGRPLRWWRVRRRLRRGATVPTRTLRPLGPGLRPLLRQRRDELAAWIHPSARRGPAATSRVRRRAVRSVFALLPALVLGLAVGLAAGRHLLATDGAVVSAYLSPMPAGAGELWRTATSSWRPLGIGAAAAGDPLGGLLAVLSWPLGGDPGRLVAVLLLGGPALAAVSAWTAASGLRRSLAVRGWTALVWAAAPPLLAACLTGRPGAVLVHLLLPLLVLALVRSLAWGSITAAAGAGLLLTGILAAAPGLAVPAAAVLLIAAALAAGASAALPQARLAGWRRLPLAALVALVPAVVLLPWWVAVARTPRLLAADPAAGWTAPVGPEQAWWHFAAVPEGPPVALSLPPALADRLDDLLGAGGQLAAALTSPTTAQVLATLLVAPVGVFALIGLFRLRGPAAVALAGWLSALLALVAAGVGERLVVGDGRLWPGPALSVLLAGLMVAAVTGGPMLSRRLRTMRPSRRRLTAVPVALALTVGPVLALAGLAAQGARPLTPTTVQRTEADVLPAVAVAEARGPGAARTLVLGVDRSAGDGQVRWALYRDGGPRFGADSAARRTAADRPADTQPQTADVVVPVVAAMLSDSGQDERAALADLAVGTIILLPPLDTSAEQALDAAPGLVRVTVSGAEAMWRVEPPADSGAGSRPGRVRVVNAAGQVTQVLASAAPDRADRVRAVLEDAEAGRRLVLAESADPGWTATLDGAPLVPATVDGWAQAFELPRHGGVLEVDHRPRPTWTAGPAFAWAWRIALALAVLLALPLPRVRQRIGTPMPPTLSSRVHRPVPDGPQGDLPRPPQVFDVDHPETGEVRPVFADDPVRGEPADHQPADDQPADDQPADDGPVRNEVADDEVEQS